MDTTISVFLQLADAVIITDTRHRIIDVNATYERVTGYSRDEIVGMKAGLLKSGLTPAKTYDDMKESLGQDKPWSGVFINRKRNKELWYSNITISLVKSGDEAYYIGVFRDLAQLKEGVYISETRKSKIQYEILKVLALSCEVRDPDIEGHLVRVQELTTGLLHQYNALKRSVLTEAYIQSVVNACILHDIGKSGIPEGILYKPGKLNVYERAIMETHPLIGADILNKISTELDDELFQQEMKIAKDIVSFHHEKWDGTGYPSRLKEDEIPFEAQIVSIVDVYDALTSRRAYKDAWPAEQAADYLRNQKGISFNPELVDIFCNFMIRGTSGNLNEEKRSGQKVDAMKERTE
ncbi:HD domain-containing protein [Paenibacillus rhizovicinus]|uniref:HD domain-containing protein n=1 Tax=Paenibacillus rhizovicinus TaxID=2704463 RepID=A0A6C0P469_9BACL|nr:HD domain-containing phosphohydrolase [Paenibacillus rhizovicinus]QHW33318.1 HD domain-containing protein [Paenibacillus rhizovicinus]